MFATTLPLAASKTDWSEFLPEKLLPAIGDTFYMVSITMLCAGLVGLIVGALLYTTREGNIFQNRFVYTILNILVNVIRPIPFIILIAALGPLTSAVVGTRLGVNAAVFAMSFGAAFAIARIVEQNMVSIDPGVIEAARAMGASKLTILFTVTPSSSLAWWICPLWPVTWVPVVWVRSRLWTATSASTMRSPGLLWRLLSSWFSWFSSSVTSWPRRLCADKLVPLVDLVGTVGTADKA